MVAITPDGAIYPCDMTDYKDMAIGSIFQGDLSEIVARASREHGFFRANLNALCAACPWYFYCRGGCTSGIRVARGDITGVDHYDCASSQRLYPELVRLVVEEPMVADAIAY